uniref:Uncharacterized protein n=1 Tax=Oryza nivara TaxID=4536 RepID=A0A0E0I094_ORYNI
MAAAGPSLLAPSRPGAGVATMAAGRRGRGGGTVRSRRRRGGGALCGVGGAAACCGFCRRRGRRIHPPVPPDPVLPFFSGCSSGALWRCGARSFFLRCSSLLRLGCFQSMPGSSLVEVACGFLASYSLVVGRAVSLLQLGSWV